MTGDTPPSHRLISNLDDLPTIVGLQSKDLVFDRFKLERCLGRGGMGEVWLAYDQSLEEKVALKLLPRLVQHDAHSVEQLKNETKRGRQLSHEHIVRVFDYYQDSQNAAIAMEYVNGEDLRTLQAREINQVFSADKLRPWVQQLLAGLDCAHRSGVVHRDLKPANLLIVNTSQVLKVADFGIARTIEDSIKLLTLGVTSRGTPCYMSPEQAMGHRPHPLDDIYSLGATLYHLLAGLPPFHTGDMTTQIMHKTPPPLAETQAERGINQPVPPEWEKTILACLEKKRANRPQSAMEVLQHLGFSLPASEAAKGHGPSGKQGFRVFTDAKMHTVPAVSATKPQEKSWLRNTGLVSISIFLVLLASWWGMWPRAVDPLGKEIEAAKQALPVLPPPEASAANARAMATSAGAKLHAEGYSMVPLYLSSQREELPSDVLEFEVSLGMDVSIIAAYDGIDNVTCEVRDSTGQVLVKSSDPVIPLPPTYSGACEVKIIPSDPVRSTGYYCLQVAARQNSPPAPAADPGPPAGTEEEAIASARQIAARQFGIRQMQPVLTMDASSGRDSVLVPLNTGSNVFIAVGCSPPAKGILIRVLSPNSETSEACPPREGFASFAAVRTGSYRVEITPPPSLKGSKAVIAVVVGSQSGF